MAVRLKQQEGGTSASVSERRSYGLLAILLLTLSITAWKLMDCQGLPAYVSRCPITPTAPTISPTASAAPVPPMAAVCPFPMSVMSPANGQSLQSPVRLIATANSASPIYNTRVYVDSVAVFFTFLGSLNQYIWVPDGDHTIEIVSEDQSGYVSTETIPVHITGQTQGISQIQNITGWINCSSVLATGAVCAAGLGTAKSALAQSQTSPAFNGGTSAKFSLEGGTHPYSNALYWLPLGGGADVSHFIYDLYFYINQGNAPQALEFDVNQTFGGTRWTWGSECNFDADGKWDIWNDSAGIWVPTDIPCVHFPSNTWIHMVWTLERVGNQVHYVSLQLGETNYPVDIYYDAQSNWFADEIDVAFQMDGNGAQQPYEVWLDQVTLNAY